MHVSVLTFHLEKHVYGGSRHMCQHEQGLRLDNMPSNHAPDDQDAAWLDGI